MYFFRLIRVRQSIKECCFLSSMVITHGPRENAPNSSIPAPPLRSLTNTFGINDIFVGPVLLDQVLNVEDAMAQVGCFFAYDFP